MYLLYSIINNSYYYLFINDQSDKSNTNKKEIYHQISLLKINLNILLTSIRILIIGRYYNNIKDILMKKQLVYLKYFKNSLQNQEVKRHFGKLSQILIILAKLLKRMKKTKILIRKFKK